MKHEDQVSNLELSMKLKELGVKQESLWYWRVCTDGDKTRESIALGSVEGELFSCDMEKCGIEWDVCDKNRSECEYTTKSVQVCYSAFTVAELGEKIGWNDFMTYGLPPEIIIPSELFLSFLKSDNAACFRAKMLIWLIENKKVKQ